MKDHQYTTIEQAWQALQSTPAYVERDTRSEWAISAKEHKQLFPDGNFCLECSQWVDEDHQCQPKSEAA